MVAELDQLVVSLARAIEAVDRDAYNSKYKAPGIGSFDETYLVSVVAHELRQRMPEFYGLYDLEVPYPGGLERCDLCLGSSPQWEWALEFKAIRFLRSNGDLEDTTIKKLLSPYDEDGSALSDARRLAASSLARRKAIMLYGFDYPNRGRKPARLLDPAIIAFEVLAGLQVSLGPRHVESFAGLCHPWHQQGRVFAWELCPV
jgi:hypothetical protein